jgi:uncharacterized protein YdcH (DUF465 family)
MKSLVTVKKFSSRKEKVQNLMHSNSKFKRMFEEYDNMSEDLYNLESSEGISITDDFINYIKVQTNYLEAEIEDFLMSNPDQTQK